MIFPVQCLPLKTGEVVSEKALKDIFADGWNYLDFKLILFYIYEDEETCSTRCFFFYVRIRKWNIMYLIISIIQSLFYYLMEI